MVLSLVASVFLLCFYSYSNAETRVTEPNQDTIRDDRYAEVPLQFVFPFYGQNFITSYMFDNGVLGFQDPSQSGVQSHWCCDGLDLETLAQNGTDISQYSFVIAPLWTDLIDLKLDTDGDGVVDSGYFTDGDTTQQIYIWRNIAEYRNAQRLNTFQVTIKPDGTYQMDYTNVNIQNHSVASGVAGDLTGAHLNYDPTTVQGIQQYFYNIGNVPNSLGSWNNNLTIFCGANPLYDPQCPGYAAAYATWLFQQQCSANPLYDSSCSGYQQAYYNQQCSLDPLYDSGCSGYQTAYFNQQCSLDPLYDPLCTGYDDAYYNQQCELDTLYDSGCTGYDAAYLLQQCNADTLYDVQCVGYQLAYIEQQCELDPLYDVTCLGYQEAIALEELNDEIIDDGIDDTEIDVVNTTIIEGIPNFITLPELPEIEVFVLEDTVVEEEVLQIETDAQSMEDSIEIEIAQLEREEQEEVVEVEITEDGSEEDIVEGVKNPFEKERDEKEVKEEFEITEDGSDEELQDEDIVPSEEPKKKVKKKTTKEEKMKMLLAKKANELTKKVEQSVSIEQQMLVQRQLLALISYVPGFDYNTKKLPQVNFYPPKPVVDHAYARWFLNDPNFGAMEDLQYNFK